MTINVPSNYFAKMIILRNMIVLIIFWLVHILYYGEIVYNELVVDSPRQKSFHRTKFFRLFSPIFRHLIITFKSNDKVILLMYSISTPNHERHRTSILYNVYRTSLLSRLRRLLKFTNENWPSWTLALDIGTSQENYNGKIFDCENLFQYYPRANGEPLPVAGLRVCGDPVKVGNYLQAQRPWWTVCYRINVATETVVEVDRDL
jgi:hypothetical protein